MFELLILLIIVLCFSLVCFIGSPYVPTMEEWAKDALDLADLDENDKVVDLGSGDGKILRLLSKKGIRSVGYEVNPLLVAFSKLSLLNTKLATVNMKNYWSTNLPSDTTVIYAFMVERDAKKLEDYVNKQLKLVKSDKIKLITFGFGLPNKKINKQTNSAKLYIFE